MFVGGYLHHNLGWTSTQMSSGWVWAGAWTDELRLGVGRGMDR